MDDLREVIARGMRHRDKRVCETGTYDEYADAALAAIKQAGFVVVPAEPTEAVINAWGEMTLESCGDIYGDGFISEYAAPEIYRAMIEASNAPT